MHEGNSFDEESAGQGAEFTELALFGDIPQTSPFDALRQEDERGEFWSARDLQPVMEYDQWRRFVDSIERAMAACRNAGQRVEDHFAAADKITTNTRGQRRTVDDIRLSRHGAYLTAINGDPRKEAIANAQVYFAEQTRKQELIEQAGFVPAASVATIPDTATPEGVLALVDVLREQALARLADAKTIASQATTIKKLKSAAEMLKTYTGAQGWVAKREFARDVQQGALDLDITLSQQEIFDYLGHIGLIIRTSGHEFDQATATAIKERKAKNVTIKITREDGSVEKRKYGKLSAKGEAYAWNRIFTALDEYGTLDLDVIRGALARR